MSTQLETPARTRFRSIPARVGIAGLATFFAASVVAAALTPGYRTTRDPISALAAHDAPYAGLMIFGFLAAAIGLTGTGLALARRFGATLSGRIATGLVLLAAGSMAVAGVARQDCNAVLPTCVDYDEAALASTGFWIHQYVSLGLFLLLVIAMFVLVRAVRRTPGLEYLKVPARVVAYGSLILTVATVTVGFGDYNGLVQRPYLALLFGWPLLLATVTGRGSSSSPSR
ncbi:DUF998 domain-containing protein [Actinoplanes sp. URMC 104]|uniref:DUF998 domain-containing protein n=1 Tax=Actinoplanes sp. URMC 104 TaxID=3423409 RepID=UPI003F195A59